MKGHERSITRVKFNRDGDLLFTASKDEKPTCWLTSDGTRVGTYDGHRGSIFDIAISCAFVWPLPIHLHLRLSPTLACVSPHPLSLSLTHFLCDTLTSRAHLDALRSQ